MKPVHIAKHAIDAAGQVIVNRLELLDSFDDAASARKCLGDMPPGDYSVVRFIEANIPVEPPPEVHKNRVGQGTTFISRTPTEAVRGAGEEE